ncbi:tyrosine-protein phosphatase non-receptor type 11-like [Saccoglossus kowalevskii]
MTFDQSIYACAVHYREKWLLCDQRLGGEIPKKEKQDKKSVQEHFTFDHTRVPLKDGEGSESYINANYIRPTFDPEGDNSETQPMYIATQGCLPQTVNDLWRMIWQEDSRVLVMTTKEIERGKVELIYTYFSFAIQILKIFDMIGSQ